MGDIDVKDFETVRREERREALEVLAGVHEHGIGLGGGKRVILITNDIHSILAVQERLRDLDGFPMIAMRVGDRLVTSYEQRHRTR